MPAAAYPQLRRAVRALRLKQGLTQEALAEQAGLDYKYYQRFELGDTPAPSLDTLERLGRVLMVKAWVLLCDDSGLVSRLTGIKDVGRRGKPGRPRKA